MAVSKKTFCVVGAGGDAGSHVARRLEAAGHAVRPVSRRAGVSLDDAVALRDAFSGAFGAYVMMPFDLGAPDLHQRERELCARVADAVRGAGLLRVVVLSGLSADLRRGSSLGAALLEDAMAALDIPQLVLLRAGWFMENFAKGLDFAAQAAGGTFATPFSPDRPMPMVSAADVGHRAADILMADDPGERIQELRGARDYTMEEATGIMAQAMRRGSVRYQQVPLAQALEGMMAAGLSKSFAAPGLTAVEAASGFDDGGGTRTPANTTPTSLEQWAREHLT
jgi:uncharacterized protein YbjT (DUF2867 family)